MGKNILNRLRNGLPGVFLILALCLGCGGGDGPAPTPPAPVPPAANAAWTVIVYMAADNNLGEDALRDLNEMELSGSDENMKIVVQIDLPENGGLPWNTTRRYLVEHDTDINRVGSTLLADLGELDMSRPDTLTDFLAWSRTAYPADHTLVVLWGHGEAWDDEEYDQAGMSESRIQAIFNDQGTDPDAFMRNFELGAALVNAGGHFDIIAFDACVMQILEVAYEIKDTASIMVASQEIVYVDGYPYDDILGTLAENPAGTSPETLASNMVQAFGTYYDSVLPVRREQCLSAFRLNRTPQVASAVESLAAALRLRLPEPGTRDTLQALRNSVEDFTALSSRYADLVALAELLQEDLGLDTTGITQAVQAGVIDSYSGPSHPQASGLSIYYPRTQVHYDMDTSYQNYNPATGLGSPCQFITAFSWDEFLADLYPE